MSTPETPYTRGEMYLSAIADGDSSGIPDRPYTRKEKYLDAIATGDSSGIPDTPYTREEMYLDAIAKNGGGGGGGGSTLINKSVDANGTYNASDDNADGYKKVTVNVPNSYTAGDEGKVVSNGELVAQSSDTVTQNGTVDTTLINSLTVNVADKWNYVWEASIEALPSGMTADSYDFTTESGAMFVACPDIDFSHIGDCEIEIECKWGTNHTVSNPQIIAKYGERDGFKIYPGAETNELFSNVTGEAVVYVNDVTQYHVYNLKISGNNCTLTIDGTPYTGHGITDSEYLRQTGIAKAGAVTSNRYMFIKSLKYSGGSYAELLSQLTNTRVITETLVGGTE